jgi:N-acyl-D-amino-acid deacylase
MRLALLFALAAFPALAQYDILIRNARVIDGTGNPWFHSSVAIQNGRIAAIGRLEGASAKRVIDAAGRVLAPGFIDVHTHVEGAIEKVPRADNYLLDGVTTIVTGNCGGSTADVARWFARLEELGTGVNVATLIGHNTVRRQVMGTENRHATPEELARMKELVHTAMAQGAAGFSTGLIYIPGAYAPTEEVVELARSAAAYEGVYASHMRDEGAQILEAIHEAARVGEQAGMPVQISHFKIDTPRIWGFSEKSIALVEDYRRRGVDCASVCRIPKPAPASPPKCASGSRASATPTTPTPSSPGSRKITPGKARTLSRSPACAVLSLRSITRSIPSSKSC